MSYDTIGILHKEEPLRMGIFVPDSLVKRLEPIRKSLNLSEELRAVLEGKVNAYEQAYQHISEADRKRHLEDLRIEYEVLRFDWVAEGQEDAKKWSETTKPRKVRYYAAGALEARQPGLPMEAEFGFHERRAPRLHDLYSLMDAEPDAEWHVRLRELYQLGWKSYLQALGNLLQSELQKVKRLPEARHTNLKVPLELPESFKHP